MEKLVYLLWPDASIDRDSIDAFRDELLARLPDALHRNGATQLKISVTDSDVAAGERLHLGALAPEALVSFWLECVQDRWRCESAIAEGSADHAGYLVVESQPLRLDSSANPSGARTRGFSLVGCIEPAEGVSQAEFIERWETRHREVALSTQSTFSYVRNEVVRPLTAGAPAWRGIVEEGFPIEALDDPYVFYDAVGSEQRFRAHSKRMVESCRAFLSIERVDSHPMSEYRFDSPRMVCGPARVGTESNVRMREPMTEEPAPDRFGHRDVCHPSIRRFAELTGDRSPIHLDPAIGRAAGYGGPIAHGLLTACWAVGALTQHVPERLRIGERDALFSDFALRLTGIVREHDLFMVRLDGDPEPIVPRSERAWSSSVDFATLNQHDERTSSGRLSIRRSAALATREGVAPWQLAPWPGPRDSAPLFAEDLPEFGPRGACTPRKVTAAQALAFAEEVGETHPLYTDEAFGRASIFGSRLVSPMLSFSLAFADFLTDLLSVQMPAESFAGHIGDRWRLLQPIRLGDTLQTRHRPLDMRRSESQPGMGIVRFGLQVVNQHDRVVQDGESVMMIPTRKPETSRSTRPPAPTRDRATDKGSG